MSARLAELEKQLQTSVHAGDAPKAKRSKKVST